MTIEPEDFIPDGVTFRSKEPYIVLVVDSPYGLLRFTGSLIEDSDGNMRSDRPATYTTHNQKEVEFLMGHPNVEMA